MHTSHAEARHRVCSINSIYYRYSYHWKRLQTLDQQHLAVFCGLGTYNDTSPGAASTSNISTLLLAAWKAWWCPLHIKLPERKLSSSSFAATEELLYELTYTCGQGTSNATNSAKAVIKVNGKLTRHTCLSQAEDSSMHAVVLLWLQFMWQVGAVDGEPTRSSKRGSFDRHCSTCEIHGTKKYPRHQSGVLFPTAGRQPGAISCVKLQSSKRLWGWCMQAGSPDTSQGTSAAIREAIIRNDLVTLQIWSFIANVRNSSVRKQSQRETWNPLVLRN